VKTAALLINEFGDLDTLLARAEEIPQPKRRQTLIDHAEQIRLSRKLVQLDCDMPFDVTLDALEVKDPDPDTLLAFLTAMEFRTVTRRVAEKLKVAVPVMPELMPASPEPSEEPDVPPLPRIDTSNYEWIRDAAGSSAGSTRRTPVAGSPSTPRQPRSTRCAPNSWASASAWSRGRRPMFLSPTVPPGLTTSSARTTWPRVRCPCNRLYPC
jgi:hypothetical protein